MDETAYRARVDQAFRVISDAFEDVDAEQADIDSAGDVLTITFANGKRCVVNTQRPVHQIWLAGGKSAWHFSFDETTQRWLDDKGHNAELFATLAQIVAQESGLKLTF